MKRTISLNIQGVIFNVEEDGYEILRKYLRDINKYFARYEDSREIIEDIEARIAEILYTKPEKQKQVISAADIEEMIKVMGSITDFENAENDPAYESTFTELDIPTEDDYSGGSTAIQVSKQKVVPHESPIHEEEQYEHEEEDYYQQEQIYASYSNPHTREYFENTEPIRKLYRDTQRKVLGGVSAGVAHYLGIDPFWIRMLFIVLFGGLAFIPPATSLAVVLYIVMWAVVPKNDNLPENLHIRKFFRDPDEAVLGGVASGLASYLGLNPMAVRVAFLLLCFGFGSGLLIYIILWVITPEAHTITQKMQMEGQPINLESIRDALRDNLNLEKGEEISALSRALLLPFKVLAVVLRKAGGFLRPVVSFSAEFVRIVGGLSLVLVGLAWMLGMLAASIAVMGWGPEYVVHIDSIPSELIIRSFNLSPLMMLNFFLTAFLPALFICLFGIMMLRKQVIWSHRIGWPLVGLWLLSAITSGVNGAIIAQNFRTQASVETSETFVNPGEEWYLTLQEGSEDERIGYDHPHLKLAGYAGDGLRLQKNWSARGRSTQDAAQNAQMIGYDVNQLDSKLLFNPHTFFKPEALFRRQQLEMTLFIPYGQPFRIDPTLTRILSGQWGIHYHESLADNVYIFDSDELTCLNCEEEIIEEGIEEIRMEEEIEEAIEEVVEEIIEGKLFQYKNFREIEIDGAFEVLITSSDQYRVAISGVDDYQQYVRIRQKNERLVIEPVPRQHRSEKIMIEISAPQINELSIGGACRGKATLKSSSNLEVKLSGASQLELNGSASHLELELIGASQIGAYHFESSHVEVEAIGASRAKVYASESLEISAVGASQVRYRGNPKHVNSNSVGASSVRKD